MDGAEPGDDPPPMWRAVGRAEVAELLARRVRRLRRELADARAVADDLRAQLDRERAHVAHLEGKIDEIHRSETWRLGRAAKAPLTPAIALRRTLATRRAGTPAVRHDAPRSAPLPVDDDARARYVTEIEHGWESPADGPVVAFAVFTTDLDEGRGDIYVAAGIGQELAALGWRRRYVPRHEWDRIPDDTDVVVAMIQTFDPLVAPPDTTTIAWIRNETDAWMRHPTLRSFDLVLCSSDASSRAIARRYAGPIGLLPLGVDTTMFRPGDGDRRGIVTTVNDWGRERQVYRALRSAPVDFPLTIAGHVDLAGGPLGRHHIGLSSWFAMPSLYRGASAVVDDFNHTTLPYGNVNSRLLEALACDAAVITNGDVGLAELGLGDVVVYRYDAELHELCRAASAGAFAERAAALGEVVRRDHSFAARAAVLDDGMRRCLAEPRHARRVIGFHPDFRITNPYQDLLYQSVAHDTEIVPVVDPFDADALDRAAELGASFVYHLHWTSTILGPAVDHTDAERRADRFVAELDRIRRHGGSIVWTVHNELPHECAHPDVEISMSARIAERCDAVHVMCEHSRRHVVDVFGADPDRVFVVPIPSYAGLYPDPGLDSLGARAAIGLGGDDPVFLFLGTIRPYKGVDLLLDAWPDVRAAVPGARLVVAGRPDHPTVPELERRARAIPDVVTHFAEVPDDELVTWFRAADVVVLPYRSGLNSSSVTLAYAMGRPVVAPAIGCIAELLDPRCSTSFDIGDAASLAAAMCAALDLDPRAVGTATTEISDSLSVETVSGRFVEEITTRTAGQHRHDGGS